MELGQFPAQGDPALRPQRPGEIRHGTGYPVGRLIEYDGAGLAYPFREARPSLLAFPGPVAVEVTALELSAGA